MELNKKLWALVLCVMLVHQIIPALCSDDWSSVAWWSAGDGYRSRKATAVPAPLTRNVTWYLVNNTLAARAWRLRGLPVWQSDPLPGLSTYMPVLSTGGVTTPDRAYLLNRGDGRLYAYTADISITIRTKPLWKSDFVCSTAVGQEKQLLSPNFQATVLVARCMTSIALVNLSNGKLLSYIRGQDLNNNLPFTFPDNHTLATWKGNTINIWNLTAGKQFGKLVRTLRLPTTGLTINSVEAGKGFLVATGKGSSSVFITTIDGKNYTSVSSQLPGIKAPYVLPRPTLINWVLYSVVTGVKDSDPTDSVWRLTALNMSTPLAPQMLFAGPAQPGNPAPQALTYSKKFVYITLQNQLNFSGYNLSTGQLGWSTLRWPREWNTPSIAAATYCCDQLYISTNVDNTTTSAQLVDILQLTRFPDATSAPPILPSECFCDDEPIRNF